ncbi:thiolase domain-containing protein [Halovivax limisalsi]|uniref:thiolase domain-containing protein n=1 Tax=Halovivax limisalsi TaxID=1453760 RepID=UPI001FFD10D2|nr:thiolase domain-containing protein [Halovivax limisalsi]
MSTATIAGVYEHPTREAPDKSTMELHADVAAGALSDAGLSPEDVDGYCTAGVPEYTFALQPHVMADYLGLDVGWTNSTDVGGSSYLSHVGHAATAIRTGDCDVCLITMAGRPRSREQAAGTGVRSLRTMQHSFERIYGLTPVTAYAMAARRHMHEYGTTKEQLAAIRVAAASHAQHNEHAMYRDPVTVEDVTSSPTVADPLSLLDCCVISDGGGAVVLAAESAIEDHDLDVPPVQVLGHGETVSHHEGGRIDLTETGASRSGPAAFDEAGLGPDDVDYAGIYDSFTITVLETLEDLGFCEKGAGGEFVEGGTLQAPDGDLPFNTAGGSLCSNHPGNRGSMPKLVEAVRQLRGDAAPPVQVDADVALVHGTGGVIGTRHSAVTVLLGTPDGGVR